MVGPIGKRRDRVVRREGMHPVAIDQDVLRKVGKLVGDSRLQVVRHLRGDELEVVVTRAIQTAAGRIIFARPRDRANGQA